MQEILNRIGVIARYNVINKQIELLIPNAQFSIDNQANAALAHVLSWGQSVWNVHRQRAGFCYSYCRQQSIQPCCKLDFIERMG